MLLPIGHDSGTVRRNPWVTYAIMALCLAAFLYTHGRTGELAAEHQRKMVDAIEYFVAHPYLLPPKEIEPYLEAFLGKDWSQQIDAHVEALRASGKLIVPGFTREKQQAELEQRVAEANAVRASHPFFRWGFVTGQATLSGAVTYMFLHGGWLHLLGNMLWLFLTAPFIEDRWGRPLFAAFFVSSGLVAAGLYMSRFPALDTPLIGASGAVAGCMGAFLVRFWNARLRYLLWLVVAGVTFSAPAWLMMPLWFLGELGSAYLSETLNPLGGGGVAYWAHVGGFGYGVLVAVALRVWHVEERFDGIVSRKIGTVSNDGVERALLAREEGRNDEALTLLAREVRRDPANREAAQAYWDTALGAGRAAEAAPALLRMIREELRAGEAELAVQHWMEFAERPERLPVEGPLALRLAREMADAERPRPAAEVLRRALEDPGTGATLALRVARVARGLDPGLAAEAARRAAASPLPGEAVEARELLAQLGEPVEAAAAPRPAAPVPAPPPPAAPAEAGGFDAEDLGAPTEVLQGTLPPAPPRDAAARPASARAVPAAGPGTPEMDDLDLEDLDLGGLDLDGLDLDGPDTLAGVGPVTQPAAAPAFAGDAGPAAGEAPPATVPLDVAAAPAPAAAPAGDDDPGAGIEPGMLDPADLESAPPADPGARPETAAAPDDWGNVSFEDAEAEPPPPAPAAPPPDAGPVSPPLRALRVMDAVPVRLRDDALSLEVEGRGKTRLRFERIDAVAVAAVEEPGRPRPVLYVDLALNWGGARSGAPLQVVRLRSDRFDPRRLMPGAGGALDALRALVGRLLEASGGVALPDREAARGRPSFPRFADARAYAAEVLGADPDA